VQPSVRLKNYDEYIDIMNTMTASMPEREWKEL
jgi:hypothetical protein